jgi:GNAT superfamily N-acetyltransferase/catechol 2,3-dioxygenase-like lactoylglutathione lyase family enzyme
MFSHVFVGVTDFDRALAFYSPLMAALGIEPRFCDRDRPWAGWQSGGRARPFFLVGRPFGGEHAPGNGQMVAFLAPSRALVDEAFAVAVASGGSSEGAPGPRPEYHASYYGAYFRDPDGNKLCVACHADEGATESLALGPSEGNAAAGPARVAPRVHVRTVTREDYAHWRPLWDGYNAFYGRTGETALPEEITMRTWERFLDPAEPVHALVAAEEGRIVGLAHYLFHRSTTRLQDVCYLQDLFTVPELRGQGIGRLLIEAVYAAAKREGSSRVYWQTQSGNTAGRALYDKVAGHHGFIVYSQEL